MFSLYSLSILEPGITPLAAIQLSQLTLASSRVFKSFVSSSISASLILFILSIVSSAHAACPCSTLLNLPASIPALAKFLLFTYASVWYAFITCGSSSNLLCITCKAAPVTNSPFCVVMIQSVFTEPSAF